MSIYLVIFICNYERFQRFCPIHRKILLDLAKYYQIRLQQVRFSWKWHFTHLFQTNLIFAAITSHFLSELRSVVRAVCNKTGSDQPILLILDSNHGMVLGYIVSKFEENWSKIATLTGPHTKSKPKVGTLKPSSWNQVPYFGWPLRKKFL